MRRKHSLHSRREEHVRDLLAFRIDDARADARSGDLQQRAFESRRISRELDSGCIRERLPVARHRGLNQATEEQSDVTNDQNRKGCKHDRRRAAALLAAASARRKAQHRARDDCDHEQPEQQAHEPHVQAHVAVQNMTGTRAR